MYSATWSGGMRIIANRELVGVVARFEIETDQGDATDATDARN